MREGIGFVEENGGTGFLMDEAGFFRDEGKIRFFYVPFHHVLKRDY
jgi:hypothetical protein